MVAARDDDDDVVLVYMVMVEAVIVSSVLLGKYRAPSMPVCPSVVRNALRPA